MVVGNVLILVFQVGDRPDDCPHHFSLQEIDCSETDFMQRSFSYEIFLLQPISKDFQSRPLLQIFLLD